MKLENIIISHHVAIWRRLLVEGDSALRLHSHSTVSWCIWLLAIYFKFFKWPNLLLKEETFGRSRDLLNRCSSPFNPKLLLFVAESKIFLVITCASLLWNREVFWFQLLVSHLKLQKFSLSEASSQSCQSLVAGEFKSKFNSSLAEPIPPKDLYRTC